MKLWREALQCLWTAMYQHVISSRIQFVLCLFVYFFFGLESVIWQKYYVNTGWINARGFQNLRWLLFLHTEQSLLCCITMLYQHGALSDVVQLQLVRCLCRGTMSSRRAVQYCSSQCRINETDMCTTVLLQELFVKIHISQNLILFCLRY